MHTVKTFAALAALVLLAAPALAQPPGGPNAVRTRGIVEKIDAKAVTVKAQDGTSTTFALPVNISVVKSNKATLADIKPGDFVASGGTRGPDGKIYSNELRIFPESMRGVGEGQNPMQQPNTVMTNATVTEVVAVPDGQTIKVKFPSGVSEMTVKPDVPISKIVQSDLAAVKAGADVNVMGAKNPDGSISATRITVN